MERLALVQTKHNQSDRLIRNHHTDYLFQQNKSKNQSKLPILLNWLEGVAADSAGAGAGAGVAQLLDGGNGNWNGDAEGPIYFITCQKV